MKRLLLFLPVVIVLSAAAIIGDEKPTKGKIKYPETRKVEQKDVYFDQTVMDPYRWLEDENSLETRQWVEAQNKVTQEYLAQIPFRGNISKRLNEVWNYEKYSPPFKEGKYYFYYKNDGVQNQSVLYILDSLNGTPRVLLDPNKFSSEGTVALTDFSVSNDGKYAVYGTAKAGSDWKEFFVIEIPSGKKLADHIEWVKFSGVSWRGDGFYYSKFKKPDEKKALSSKNEYSKVFYHKIGTAPEKDELVFQDSIHPLRSFYANVTEDEKVLVISESESTSGNGLYVKDLTDKNAKFKKITPGAFENDYGVVDHHDGTLFIHTNNKAPRYRLIAVDLKDPSQEKWKDILPQHPELLEGVSISNNRIVAEYMKDVQSKMMVYDLAGKKLQDIPLPGFGVVQSFNAKKTDSLAFFTYTTFTAPPVIYKYNINKNESTVFRKSKTTFDSDNYETRQVFYESKDGTRIPMFVTHKKGITLNGNNPTLLYAYGGFNISSLPSFRTDYTAFLENGGIYALANIRGGGEYGQDWHKAGTQLQKQNVFDDFIAAAEYLIREKYTSNQKLAITGRSNGGLLIGAVMTQRPELFKVAVPVVGVLDMLRYHKFTIGYAWATDYGTCEDEKHFRNLIKYSPVHNVKNANYPATLVMTGDHDDRVVPAHSYKFIAALQDKQQGEDPVLIRIDTNAGHGAGKPVSKTIEEAADMWSFIFYNLGMEM